LFFALSLAYLLLIVTPVCVSFWLSSQDSKDKEEPQAKKIKTEPIEDPQAFSSALATVPAVPAVPALQLPSSPRRSLRQQALQLARVEEKKVEAIKQEEEEEQNRHEDNDDIPIKQEIEENENQNSKEEKKDKKSKTKPKSEPKVKSETDSKVTVEMLVRAERSRCLTKLKDFACKFWFALLLPSVAKF
jgi:hypothetical protein